MSRFLPLRRWVDRNVAPGGGGKALLPMYLPLMAMFGVEAVADGPVVAAGWIAAAAAAGAWGAFVLWRAWRLAKAAALRSDRAYDRGGKLDLPPEYARTRSAVWRRRVRCRRID